MKERQLKKGKHTKKKIQKVKEIRNHRVAFMLNDTEYNAIQRHLKKYKIKNKSDWYRRTILVNIWNKLEEDFPMLFEENEMRQGKLTPVES